MVVPIPVDTPSDSAYTPTICLEGYLIVQHQNSKWSRTVYCSSGTPAAPSVFRKGCGFGCILAKNTAIRRGNRRWVTDLALNIGTGGDYSHHLICLDGKRTANANDPTADPETPAA